MSLYYVFLECNRCLKNSLNSGPDVMREMCLKKEKCVVFLKKKNNNKIAKNTNSSHKTYMTYFFCRSVSKKEKKNRNAFRWNDIIMVYLKYLLNSRAARNIQCRSDFKRFTVIIIVEYEYSVFLFNRSAGPITITRTHNGTISFYNTYLINMY